MRLLTRKLWRAFPELDRYSDEQCRRFVRAARGSWLRRLGRGLCSTAVACVPLLACVMWRVAIAALRGRTASPNGSWLLMGGYAIVLVASILAAPVLAYVCRDLLLRRRVRYVLRDRGSCVSCRYSLIGVPVPTGNVVVCPECASPCEVDPALTELSLDALGQRVFAPAPLATRGFWNPSRRRHAVRALKVGAVLLVVGGLGFVGIYEYSLRRQAARAKAATPPPDALNTLAASRQPPKVSDDEPNGWAILMGALDLQTEIDLRTWKSTPGTPTPDFSLVGEPPPEDDTPGRKEERARAEALARQLIEVYRTDKLYIELDKLAAAPRAIRDSTLGQPSAFFANYTDVRNLARMNAARMVIARERDDPAEYAAAFRSTLLIADVLYRQPALFDGLVANAIEALAYNKVRELLTANPTAVWLDALENETSRAPGPHSAALAFEGEHMFGHQMLADLFSDPSNVRFGVFSSGVRAATGFGMGQVDPLLRLGSFEENVREYDLRAAARIEAARTPRYLRTTPLPEGEDSRLLLVRLSGLGAERMLQSFDQITLDRGSAVAMIGLERFRLANGRYPSTLAELAPTYVKELPIDPWSGLPLGYRLNDAATDPQGRPYLLYCVGSDKTDNGGRDLSKRGALTRWDVLKEPPVTGTKGFDFVLNDADR
ncbi:MAG: hypothetical protein ACOYN0_01490 [Phycisphaerales bacterium]